MDIGELYREYGYSPVVLGERLFKDKKISRAVATKDFKVFRYVIEDGFLRNVKINLDDEYQVSKFHCDCRQFSYERVCQHVICGLIHLREFKSVDEKFRKIEAKKAIIQGYSQRSYGKEEEINLEIYLNLRETPPKTVDLELKIGLEKTYIVKDIGSLLNDLNYSNTRRYGNHFIYDPENQYFNQRDKRFLDFLSVSLQGKDRPASTRKIVYQDNGINAIMENLLKKDFYLTYKDYSLDKKRIKILEEDPQIDLYLKEKGQVFSLTRDDILTFPITQDLSFIYYDGAIYKTSREFSKRNKILYQEFISKPIKEIQITRDDLDFFVNKVLRTVSSVSKINLDESLKKDIRIESLEAEIYVDYNGLELKGDLVFNYGENKISYNQEAEKKDYIIVRDEEMEEEIFSVLEKIGFKSIKGDLIIEDEDTIFSIISGEREIPEISNLKIYYSQSVKRLSQLSRTKLKSVFSYNPGIDLLEVGFKTDGIGDIDYASFLESVKEKKKYFRLKSGDYISFDRDTQELFQDLYKNGDMDLKKFSKGKLNIPKYRSFYLDAFIESRQLDNIIESKDIKKLVERVKSSGKKTYPLPSGIMADLRDYQLRGYKWMKNLQDSGFSGILADEMGLGKTLQAICFIKSLIDEGQGQALVIAPTSTLYNWYSEFSKFAPSLNVALVTGTIPDRQGIIKTSPDVYITSYPLIRNDFHQYEDKEFSVIVVDEAQFIKNHNSMSAKAVKKLKGKNRLALTGTPIENSLAELHSIFDFLMPGFLLSRKKFSDIYENPIIKDGDKEKTEKLKSQIRPFILRRLKKDVLKDLPDKIEQDILIELKDDQKKLYLTYLNQSKEQIKEDIENQGYNRSRMKILAIITRLRQISTDPATFIREYNGGSAKIDALLEILESIFEAGSRVLLFSSFTSVLKNIEKELKKNKIEYEYLDGSTPILERKKAIDAFNMGKGDIFLISLKAGGTGLNLTSADTVIHFDPWWNPQVENQATDRAHRIGQKKTVQVIRMIARGTIEERIRDLQNYKKDLYDKIIEDGETLISKLSQEEIMSLFEMGEN